MHFKNLLISLKANLTNMSDKHVITKISRIDLLSSFIQGCHFLLNTYIQ